MRKLSGFNFDSVVTSYTAQKVVVKVAADRCPGCKMLAPILDKVAQGMPDTAFFEIDADDSTVRPVLLKYVVTSLPTLLVFESGTLTKKQVGVLTEQKLRELLA